MENNLYSFRVKAADHSDVALEKYKGRVLLIVNVASKCGFTPQYDGLEKLFQTYKSQGFTILAFPCNQFGAQEPGSDSEIQQFCSLTYNVNFPVLAKVEVNGEQAAPLYKWLKSSQPGILGTEAIKWNFTKFLINRNGKVVERFPPNTEPSALTKPIESLLANGLN